jgi:hypothetical protein
MIYRNARHAYHALMDDNFIVGNDRQELEAPSFPGNPGTRWLEQVAGRMIGMDHYHAL